MRHYFSLLLIAVALSFASVANAQVYHPDEDEYDESIRRPVRRLHPEREREKARKKLQAELDAKKQQQSAVSPDDDPWSTTVSTTPNNKRKSASAAGQSTTKTDAERERLQQLLDADYSLKQYVAPAPEPMRWRDDPIVENTASLLRYVRRESGTQSQTRYLPAGASMQHQDNGIFLYFDARDGRPDPLHLRVQYYADDPLRFNDIIFTIDGFDYTYRARAPQRGKGTGRMIWELSDQHVTTADRDLVYALSHANWVRMALIGSDGIRHIKMLTEQEIKDFNNILQLYRAMGGTIKN